MELKYHPQPGYLAWSNSKNHSELLASASLNEQHGLYSLDILEVDLQDRNKKLNVIGSAFTDTPFRCIAWDNFGEKQGVYQNGLIFTGMDDGSFRLWNPADIINTYQPRQGPPPQNILDTQTCVVYEEEPQEGAFPTMCCEWNSLKNNFLAFGGTDVLLLNVGKNPSQPELIQPGSSKNPHINSYVTSVSWNREVPHILASGSENGQVALWDIKTNKSIFSFKDSAPSSGNRNVTICWSKSISTQIAVTLDDQKRNDIQIWDLRNQKGPVIVIDKLHTKGINAMDWSQTQPELILASSKDNHLACWNYTQEETPLSSSTIEGGAFTVKWSKKLPSIYATSSEDKISVYSLSDNLFGYVPKWFKVPARSTILGAQAALTYSEHKGPVLVESKLPKLEVDKSLKAQIQALGNVLEGGVDQFASESEINNLIKAKISGEADCGIYDYLGLNREKIVEEAEKYTGKKSEFSVSSKINKEKKSQQKAKKGFSTPNAFLVFEQMMSKKVQVIQEDDQNNEGEVKYDMVPRNFNWNIGKERLVKENILIGNYESAIHAALKCGRTAEALIIAYSVDHNLFASTLKTFFTQTTDNFITDVLKCIAYKEPEELIAKYDLDKWKQCISLIYSMSSRDKRPELLKLLAKRLVEQTEEGSQQNSEEPIPETYPPIICYILAEDFQHIAKLYANNLKNFKSGSLQRKKIALEYTRRLVTIYEGITVEIPECKQYNQLLRQSMFICIESREKVVAYSLCNKLPHQNRILDYLVSNTKDLEKYKANVQIRSIVLPTMQPKKPEKKVKPEPQPSQPHPKQKKGIFPKEEESRTSLPPPLPVHKKREEQTSGGFSPYQNAPKPAERTAPPKKNLNNPPPPPPGTKKVINQPYHHEQESQPERQVHRPPPQVTPHKKTQPPPPPPRQTHDESMEEDTRPAKRPPPARQPPPPPPATQKKMPPPQPVQVNHPTKHSPPPPPPLAKHETEESEERYQPPPPPVKKKSQPPPPPQVPSTRVAPEPDRIPVKEETPTQYAPPPKRPPGVRPPPPQKKEQKYEEPDRSYEEPPSQPVQPVRRNVPGPPTVKRGPPGPPPPPRR